MPRQVDHAQRRREIAHAVWAVIGTAGLDAVSLRSVAAEAGVSMGRVQHYFPSKDAMVLHACEAMADAAYARALDGGGAADDDGGGHGDGGGRDGRDGAWHAGLSPRQLVRSVLLTGIPVDAAQRVGASVWFAFVTKAAVWPELAAVVREQLDGARTFVMSALQAAAAAGALRRDVDPAAEATALLGLADGLVLRVMVGALAAGDAVAAVDAHLATLFVAAPESSAR